MTQSELESKFPFLTGIKHNDKTYLGIVENVSNKMITFYDYNNINDQELKKLFLRLGGSWWWETNRTIPIGVFLFAEMQQFNPHIKTFKEKEIEVMFGPYVSLDELSKKKIGKKRTVKLIRNMD